MAETTVPPEKQEDLINSDFSKNDVYEDLPEELREEMRHKGKFFDRAIFFLKRDGRNGDIQFGYRNLLEQKVIQCLYDVMLIPVTNAAHSPSRNEIRRRTFHVTVNVLLGEHPKWGLYESEVLTLLGNAYTAAGLGCFFIPEK